MSNFKKLIFTGIIVSSNNLFCSVMFLLFQFAIAAIKLSLDTIFVNSFLY
jgi:hypothetical protein